MFRWSFMFMVQYGMHMSVQLYMLMKKYRVINKTAYAVGICARAIFITFPVMVTQFIVSLLNGTAFHETGFKNITFLINKIIMMCELIILLLRYKNMMVL
jgi:hypothetical protein